MKNIEKYISNINIDKNKKPQLTCRGFYPKNNTKT